jgi:hypothetical protein
MEFKLIGAAAAKYVLPEVKIENSVAGAWIPAIASPDTITLSNIYKYTGCKLCLDGIGSSKFEDEIENFLINNNIETKRNSRKVISPKELDIFISEYKIAIEFNGLYWHSEISGGKDKNYHLNKTEECKKRNIQLIHIFEDEYDNKKNIIEHKLKHILNISKAPRIYARKCTIKEIDASTKNKFLNEVNNSKSFQNTNWK